MIEFLILTAIAWFLLGARSSGRGGGRINMNPKTPRPVPPIGLKARKPAMARADAFVLIEECLACLYSPDEAHGWWRTPLDALGGETPKHFINHPAGPERLLEHLQSLGM